MAKNQVMFNEYKYIWPKEYTQDMFDILKMQELEHRPINLKSPQIELRTPIINWMKCVCAEINLNILVLHLSVNLLDTFMDNYDVQPYRLKLVATTCIVIAVKLEESGTRVPTYTQIYSINKPENDIPDLTTVPIIERKVLDEFRWRLTLPSIATFVSFLLPLAVQPSDISSVRSMSERQIQMEMRDHLKNSLNIILFDLRTLQMSRSELACACVLVARLELGLEPIWPEHLRKLTSYNMFTLAPALHTVFSYYRQLEEESPDQSCDSGYGSHNNSPNLKLQ